VREVTFEAYAKINLFLRVLGLREDEYHELESFVVPISLSDKVTCRPARKLSLRVAGQDAPLPPGPDNLAVVAALALGETSGFPDGAEIELEKHIPVAAGLGGGSADAAAVLLALDELWGCGLTEEELSDIAAAVGSDVPAMLAGRPVLARGRGERLRPARVPRMWWVVVPGGFGVRTPDAFRWWDEDGGPTGPDPKALVDALAAGDLAAAAPLFYNDLEEPVFTRHREVAETKRSLLDAGAVTAIMCGSGPTVAGLAAAEADARRIACGFPAAIVTCSPP